MIRTHIGPTLFLHCEIIIIIFFFNACKAYSESTRHKFCEMLFESLRLSCIGVRDADMAMKPSMSLK